MAYVIATAIILPFPLYVFYNIYNIVIFEHTFVKKYKKNKYLGFHYLIKGYTSFGVTHIPILLKTLKDNKISIDDFLTDIQKYKKHLEFELNHTKNHQKYLKYLAVFQEFVDEINKEIYVFET